MKMLKIEPMVLPGKRQPFKKLRAAALFVGALVSGLISPLIPTSNIYSSEIFDISAEYNYSTWLPGQIRGVEYSTTGLNAVEVKFDLEPMALTIYEKYSLPLSFLMPTIKYMFTPENSAQQEMLLEQNSTLEGAQALSYFWANIPLFYWKLGNRFLGKVNLKYENARFISALTAQRPSSYINFNGTPETIEVGATLSQRNDFEKITALFEFQQDELFSYGVGAFAQRYGKPYAVTIDGVVQSDLILDSKFHSQGFVFLLSKRAPQNQRYYWAGEILFHYGAGDIDFAGPYTMNDLLGEGYTAALILINIEAEGGVNVTKRLRLASTLGYDYYDFHIATKTEDGIQSEKEIGALDLNIDQMFYLKLGLIWGF